MAALVKQSLVDQIYNQLRNEIIDQKISWGEKLNVNEMQEKFGISSTPIREAINRLQKEGLVEYKNNIGAKVIDIKEKDIIEIQKVAFTLDCAAIKYAMETGEIEAIAKELSEKIHNYQSTDDEVLRLNYIEQFSNVFYKYSGNSRLIAVSQFVKGQQSMLRNAYRKVKKNTSSIEDHINVYNAVLLGNVDDAIKAIEENYRKGTEVLLKAIKSFWDNYA